MAEGIEDQQEHLCQRCRGIDLEDLFKERTSQTYVEAGPPIIFYRVPEWASGACSLCNFFLGMISGEERSSTEVLYIFKTSQALRNGSTNGTPLDAPKMEFRPSLTIQSHPGTPPNTPGIYVNCSKGPNKGVILNHEKVDYEPLRGWCKMIEQIPREAMDVLPVNVIDCHKRELVPVKGPCDYVALSYVWGKVVVQETAPEGQSLPDRLPRAVEDAMAVVRELGLRYLWVDRYCLDQSNKAEFQAQLDQMADIYRHALLTIIGAAGSDADYGLPGVNSRVRTKQPRIKIGDCTLWSSMSDPRKLVRESAWMSRAWTYQEGVFSCNWIAFTDEQVFYQRSNKEWATQERWWKISCEMFPQGGLGADANCPLLNMYDNVWKNEGAIHFLLGQYTTRNLTYESDAVNGALGLLKRCENGPYCMSHYFGIPILGPLINHRKAMGRDLSRSWTLTEAFLVNLCWKGREAGARRLEFPSWSWAGWQVDYERPAHSLTYLGLYSGSTTKVDLFVRLKELIEWETMCYNKNWDVYEDTSTLPRELYIQGPTIPLTICRGSGIFHPITNGHAAALSPMSLCAKFSEDDCEVFIEVNLVDAAVEATIAESGAVNLKGVLLRQKDHQQLSVEDKNYHDDQVWCFALLVLDGEDGATRVGSLELKPENYVVHWKSDVDHAAAKDGTWIATTYTEYMDCSDCRKRALQSLVGNQKVEMTKIL
ncbi:putative Heterokaryon incompatibility protein-domain-containing protein [Seiridium cardinale]